MKLNKSNKKKTQKTNNFYKIKLEWNLMKIMSVNQINKIQFFLNQRKESNLGVIIQML